MRKLFIISLLPLLTLSGCQFVERFIPGKGKDTLAAWEARQDSMKRAELLKSKKIEEARMASEKAIQDSLQLVRENQARNRFHVIIGSFKVPANADDFQRQVSSYGFQSPTIIESPNGFRMVSVGAFQTYSMAANEIQRINRSKETPIELWVYESSRN